MQLNEKFFQKGVDLIPELIETRVEVESTVKFDGEKLVPDTPYTERILDEGDSFIIDFGDHEVGHFTFTVDYDGCCADAPAYLEVAFTEQPRELLENTDEYNGWISKAWIQKEKVHLDVLPTEYTFPRRYAFRYVKITALSRTNKYKTKITNAYCVSTTSADYSKLEKRDFGDKYIEKLDKIACRTLSDCMQKFFEDGPKRDRRLWSGDLRLQAIANYETFKNYDLVKSALYLIASMPMESGQSIVCLFLEPKPLPSDDNMVDYSILYIKVLEDYFNATGDMETLKELYPFARGQIDYVRTRMADGVVATDVPAFIDWCKGLKKTAAMNGVYLYSLKSAARLAGHLGFDDDVTEFETEYQRASVAVKNKFFDEKIGLYVSEGQVSYASQVWMVLAGLNPSDGVELLKRAEAYDGIVKPVTPYMYHNLIDAYMEAGSNEDAFRILKFYWGGMEKCGADTFFEIYNPENPDESPYGGTAVNSYCHAWACAPAYFYRKYTK